LDRYQAPEAKELIATDAPYSFPEVAFRLMVQQEADFAVFAVTAPGFTKQVTEELMHFVRPVVWRTIFYLDSPTLARHRSKVDIRKSSRPATLVVNAPYRQVGISDLLQHGDEAVN